MIPIMKDAFLEENKTKKDLANFILETTRLSMGEQCLEFEKEFSLYQRRSFSVLFNSGGSANLALLQSLKNLGRLKDGDSIAFSAVTFSTNVMPIIQLGLKPVIIDCKPETLNTMAEHLLERLENTKLAAFFITNALGFAGDLFEIKKICETRGILLLEDNCESLGSELSGEKTGNFGIAASFSFFVAHHMSTIEGGMVCTDDEDLAEMLKMVRANGWDRNLSEKQKNNLRSRNGVVNDFEAKYTFYDLGYNLRPTEITGFLGRKQLLFLPESIKKRELNYLKIEKIMRRNDDFIVLDHNHISRLSSFAVPIICKTSELRKKYLEKFSSFDIEIRPIIAGNIQRQIFYKKYVSDSYILPGAEKIHGCGFYFGNRSDLTEEDLKLICKCLVK